ncbi:hypothetical protein ACJW30_05G215200 [Castanea mollissima]
MGLLEIKEEFVRSTPNETIQESIKYCLPSGVYPLFGGHILPSWVDDHKSECCEWERVTCNSTTGHVTHLSLHNIWEFDIESNFYFDYPFYFEDMVWFLNVSLFESFKELRSLDLSLNAIGGWIEHKGFESLLRLNKLESLDLDCNIFNRSIIHSLRLLTSLKSLNLSYNALEGSLPTKELSVFEDLEILDLRNNQLNGSETVQGSISLLKLKKLGRLDLGFNMFNRSIIQSLRLLKSLKTLSLSDNYWEGSFPAKGSLPSSFGNMSLLDTLDVSHNNFSGEVPKDLFVGQIPCETTTFELLDLSHNLLDGSLPLWSSTWLKHLFLEENNFSGSIPEPFLNMSELRTLDISDNKLSGSIPSAISKASNLRILLLGGNQLSGNISTQLCQLTNITLMDLSRNLFFGTIPRCFGHTLSFGTFGAQYRASIFGGLFDETADSLYYLDVEINFVTKYRLSSYKDGILNYMSGLDLSCNNLTGEIPLELGQLQRIHALNLSHNQLTGSIPKSFSDLTNAESLDLSHNRLSGEIPPQLIELTFLEVFSVAYNNLSGRTPDMKAQFGTFDASSYDGNPFLCGLPLEKNCTSRDDSPTPMHSSDVSDEKWYKVDQTVFFTSFLVTYIMFCVGVITVLYINTHWRLRCYNLVKDCMYSCYFSISITLRKLSAYLYN